MNMQNLLYQLRMLKNDKNNVRLSNINKSYKNLQFQDEIAAYIIKKSFENFDVALHYELLTKTSKKVLQKIYPGILSHYFKCITSLDAVDTLLCQCLLHVLTNVDIKKDEQKLVCDFIYKNFYCKKVFDKCLYEFMYNRYKIANFGLVLLENNVDINLQLIEEEISNMLELVVFEQIYESNELNNILSCEKYDGNKYSTDKVNDNNNMVCSITHKKMLKDYMKDNKNDKRIVTWPENELFAKETDFTKFLNRHIAKFIHNKEIQRYLRNKNSKLAAKQIGLCDIESSIIHIVRNYCKHDAYNLLSNVESIHDKHLHNITLLCMTDKKFVKNIQKYNKLGNVNKYITKNYDLIVNSIVTLLHTETQKGLAIFANLISVHYNKCAIKVFSTIFDLMFEQDNIKLYLFCLYKIAKCKTIDRSCIWYIFEELLYLDKDDYRIRCCVFEIINKLIVDYYEMDKYIDETNKKVEDKEDKKEKKEKKSNNVNIYKNNKRICDIEYKLMDKKNIKVIANKIWDDFVEDKNIFEYLCSLKLLTTIIKCTDNFYEQRLQKNKVFDKILQQYDTFEKTEQLNTIFYRFVSATLQNINLTKQNIEKLYNLCVKYEHTKIVKKLVKIDFYFIYYLSQARKTKQIGEIVRSAHLNNGCN
ncbi:hypothetical protein BDAP_002295 [Binucleata daphniae]